MDILFPSIFMWYFLKFVYVLVCISIYIRNLEVKLNYLVKEANEQWTFIIWKISNICYLLVYEKNTENSVDMFISQKSKTQLCFQVLSYYLNAGLHKMFYFKLFQGCNFTKHNHSNLTVCRFVWAFWKWFEKNLSLKLSHFTLKTAVLCLKQDILMGWFMLKWFEIRYFTYSVVCPSPIVFSPSVVF